MSARPRFLGRPRGGDGWGDEPGDPLVARLEQLVADTTPRDEEAIARVGAAAQAAFAAASEGRAPAMPDDARDARRPIAAPASRPARRAIRRLPAGLAVAAAIVVLLGGIGTVATVQARPGQPLYGLRVALEEVLLPGEPAARLGAQLDRLDARLADAGWAAEAGDWPAAGVALRAYARIAAGASAAGAAAASADDVALERARHQCREIEGVRARPGSEPWTSDIDAAAAACASLVNALGGPAPRTPPPGQSGGTPVPGRSASPTGSPRTGPGSPGAPGGSPGGGSGPRATVGPGAGGQASPAPRPSGTGGSGGGGTSSAEPGGGPGPSSGPGGSGGGSGSGGGGGGGGSGGSAGGSSPSPSGGGSGGSGASAGRSSAPDPSTEPGPGGGSAP